MAINWDGFIMGVGDYTTERLKEERAMKMQEKLAELKEKYDVAAEERKTTAEARKVKGSRDAAGQPGMVEDVNEFGEVIGTRRLDEFTKSQREQDRKKFELDQENTRSTIDARKRQLELDAERNTISRERNSIESRSSTSTSGPTNVADALVQPYLESAQKVSPTEVARLRLLADNAVAMSTTPGQNRDVRSIMAELVSGQPVFGDPMAEPRELPTIERYRAPTAPLYNYGFKLPGTR